MNGWETSSSAGTKSSLGRKVMLGLIVVYGLSVLASIGLWWRGGLGRNKGGEGVSSEGLLSIKKGDAVGWVSIQGPIMESSGGRLWEPGVQQWIRRIKDLARKPEVKALVLEINSPGGSVATVQELYSQILKVRREEKKPVVAVMGDVAASGGYYIAMACDKIVAHPGTLTGSIGVIFDVGNVEGLFHKLGVRVEAIKSGSHKDIGSPTRPLTPEEKKILQGLIDDAYAQFLDAVTEGRNLPLEKVKPLADGRIYTGRQAQALGLVDVLGDDDEAVRIAAQLAGIKGKPRVIREVDPLEQFKSLLDMAWGRSSRFRLELGWGLLEYRWLGRW